MISSLLHFVGLRPRVYYTLTNFKKWGKVPLPPPPQYANAIIIQEQTQETHLLDIACSY